MNSEEKGREVSLYDYINLVYRHRVLIIVVFVITTLGAWIFSLLSPPVYQASSIVKLALKETRLNVIPEISPSLRTVDPVQSQIEIIKSRALLENLVMKHGLNISFLTPVDAFEFDTLWTTRRAKEGIYTVKFKGEYFQVFAPDGSVIGNGRLGEPFDGGVLGFLIRAKREDYPLVIKFIVTAPDRVALSLKGIFRVTQKGQTDLAVISAQGSSPDFVKKMADALADEYVAFTLYGMQEEAKALRSFLEEQLDKVERELRQAEDSLRAFKERAGIFLLDESARTLIERLSALQSELAKAETEKQEAEHKLASLRAQLGEKTATFEKYKQTASSPEVSSNPLVRSLKEKLTSLEIQKAMLLEKYTELHPEVVAVNREIAKTKEELNRAVANALKSGPSAGDPIFQNLIAGIIESETKIQSTEGRINALEQLIKKYEAQMKLLPQKEVQLAELTRNVEANRAVYSMLINKLEETKIAEAQKSTDAKVIEYATKPLDPIKPRKKMNVLLGAILGLVLGLGGAFVLEYVDVNVKTPEEVEELLGVQVLGNIPYIKSAEDAEPRVRLITNLDPKSVTAEVYRSLKVNLKFASTGEPIRTFMVSSAKAEEGKTLTAVNLAITSVQAGERVILVDADMRNPSVHRFLEMTKSPGFTDVLKGEETLDDAIKHPEFLRDLAVLTCGSDVSNTLEVINSESFNRLLNELVNRYDTVIFDSPPILLVSDTLAMADRVKNLLLVVRAGYTERPALIAALRALRRANINLVGAVVNAIHLQKHYGYYYPYKYYGYEEREKRKGKKKFLGFFHK